MKQLEHKGIKCWVRENTTDIKAFDEVIRRHSYFKGNFQPDKNDVWLDLGANVGTFSCFVGAFGCKVFAYEPEPECFAITKKNFEDNKISGDVFQLAVVGDMQKRMFLFLGKKKGNFWRNSLVKNWQGQALEVKCVNFFDSVTPEINAVKMDIEGSEFAIFDSPDLDFKNIKKFVFEYHFDIDSNVARFRDRMEKLKKHFGSVMYSEIPAHVLEYKFFPASKIIFCLK